MADSMSVGSATTPKVDLAKWKKLTPQEIIKQESKGEEIPAEIINWAQQMTAIAKIPDNVTYEQVDGDVGLDALAKLGIEEENPVGVESENAMTAEKTEEPGAVKDVAQDTEVGDENDENIFINPPVPGQAAEKATEEDVEEEPDKELGLADTKLTTDPEEIRKRKARKGIQE